MVDGLPRHVGSRMMKCLVVALTQRGGVCTKVVGDNLANVYIRLLELSL
jgi:hypothetical protein